MKNAIRWVLILLCIGVFCFAGYKLLSKLLDYREAETFYEAVADTYVVPEEGSPETPAVQRVEPEDGGPVAYVREDGEETAPISVDFESLLADNGDVVGWIYGEDTVINYPVVQGSDNEYYLHRMLDGNTSASGAIFLDYRCSADFSDDNSILYGHNMRNGSMFHSLVEYGNQEYYDAHPVLYLLTPEQNYAVKLFAGFVTDSDGWVYVFQFNGEEEKAAYLERAVEESDFQALVTPETGDRLLILSTCSYEYDNARYVVLGVLTPIA